MYQYVPISEEEQMAWEWFTQEDGLEVGLEDRQE